MNKQDVKNLKKRYLIWLYLITKEAFDRYERKFTQFDIDKFILEKMEEDLKEAYLPQEKKALEKYVNDYRQYIDDKEQACLKLKYKDKKINPYFLFLDVKLDAIEKAVIKEFDKKTLEEIKGMYEQEMTDKILKNVKHK